jgi:hypothetical protein
MESLRTFNYEVGGNTIEVQWVGAGPTSLSGNYRVSVQFEYGGYTTTVECTTKNVGEVQELNRVEDKIQREFYLFELVYYRLEDRVKDICDRIDEWNSG